MVTTFGAGGAADGGASIAIVGATAGAEDATAGTGAVAAARAGESPDSPVEGLTSANSANPPTASDPTAMPNLMTVDDEGRGAARAGKGAAA